MKKLTLLIFLLFSLLPLHAVKKIEANPINIAVMLTQETDTARMTSTLRYYGYKPSFENSTSYQTASAGLSSGETYTFTHQNGSVIRYKFTNTDQKYPTIEVTSKVSQKEKDQTLKNLNFQKTGNSYERKTVGYTTRCVNGPHGLLILTRY